MIQLLKNRNFILLLSIALGLIVPQVATYATPAMLPALALAMVLATINVPNDFFRKPRALIIPSIAGLLMTYLVLGGLILILAALLIHNHNLWIGFVLIAAVPPAIAVIPFTAILDGDVSYSLIGTVASYLGALIIMPFVLCMFVGANVAQPGKLLEIMVILIVLPLVLSRIILYFNLASRIEPYRGLITDWSFFVVLYTMIGLNQTLILGNPLVITPVIVVVLATTFLLGFMIERIGPLLKIENKNMISLVLLGTLKNQGIAGGLALSLFDKETALPSAIYSVFMILYFIWLDVRRRWQS